MKKVSKAMSVFSPGSAGVNVIPSSRRVFLSPVLCLTFAATLVFGSNPIPPKETCPTAPCKECDESCTSGTCSSEVGGGMGADATQEGSENPTGSPAGNCDGNKNANSPGNKKPDQESAEGQSIECPSAPSDLSTPVPAGGLHLNVNLGKSPIEELCASKEKPSASTEMAETGGFSTGGSNYSAQIYDRSYGKVSGLTAGQYEQETGTKKLKWVRTGDSFVSLQDLGGGATGYDMIFYNPADVTGSTPASGAVSLRTVRIIQQPDEGGGTTKVGRMLELRGSSGGKITEFRFRTYTGGKSWETKEGTFTGTLASPSVTFLKKTLVGTAPVSGDATSYTEARTITDLTSSTVVLDELDTYKKITLSTGPVIRLVKHQVDPTGRDLLTQHWYHTSGPAQGMVQRVHYPNGFWRHYEYMLDNSRLYRTYTPFENTAPPAATADLPDMAGTVVEESDFASTPGWDRRDTTYTDGNVTRRTWTKKTGDDTTGFTWTVVKAGDNSTDVSYSGNQTTVRVYYPKSSTSISSNRLKRIDTHDNQVTQYTYSRLTASGTLPARMRTVEQTGPNPGGSATGGLYTLAEGTETVTELTEGGRPVIDKTTDIASGKILSDIVVEDADDYGRPTVTLDQLLGRYRHTSYACCGVEWEQDFDGMITFNGYDEFGKLVEQQKGYRPGDDNYTAGIQKWYSHSKWTRDILGRAVIEKRIPHTPGTGAAEMAQTVSTTTYNTAGQLTKTTDAMGKAYLYNTAIVSGYFTESKSWPLSGTPELYRTRVVKYNRSTSIFSSSTYASAAHCQTSPIPAIYSSGSGDINNSVLQTTTYSRDFSTGLYTERWNNAGKAGTGNSDYRMTASDLLGRILIEYQPSSSGPYLTTQYFYYSAAQSSAAKASFGKLHHVNYPDGRTVFYEYDAQGRQSREITDLDNNAKDLSSDRVVETLYSVTAAPGSSTMGAHRTITRVYLSGTTPIQIRDQVQSADGLYSKSDDMGRITETAKIFASTHGSWTITASLPDGTEQQDYYATGRLAGSDRIDKNGNSMGSEQYYPDSRGRIQSVADYNRDAWTEYSYTGDDRMASLTEHADGEVFVTEYFYDAAGNLIIKALPDGREQIWTYNALGQMVESNGVEQYAVKHEYDDRGGRLRKLTTGTGTSGVEGTTTWIYNTYGWLTGKRDPSNQGVDYGYNSSGQLSERKWARMVSGSTRLTATYTYWPYTGEFKEVTYNDSGTTPGYSVTYDRLGRQDVLTQGTNSWDYDYDSSTLLPDKETVTYGGSPGLVRVVDRRYGSPLRRNEGWDLKTTGGTVEHSNTYGYDSDDGRLLTVTDGTDTFTYSYLYGSHLVESVTGPHSITVNNVWEEFSPRDVLAAKVNKKGGTVISQYGYTINEHRQRTQMTMTGSAFGSPSSPITLGWQYNGRGEVESADRSGGSAADRFYAYDTAGNRTQWRYGGATSSTGTLVSYTANNRNEYAGSGAISGGRSASPTYDNDGNQLTTFLPANPANPANPAQWIWNAENQLIEAKSGGTSLGIYKYDPLGRRLCKTVSGTTTWFIYDGWNLIGEYVSGALVRAHTWGTDLSGSMQGAGGVGGLLSTRITGTGTRYPLYDGNGNITQYVQSSGTTPVFSAEYDPSGIITASSGSSAGLPFGFSTKYQDAETGLLYYGYRYLDTQNSRWLNRDPIGEKGGLNLYSILDNDTVNLIDLLGMELPKVRPAREADELDRQIEAGGKEAAKKSEEERKKQRDKKLSDNGGREWCGFVCEKCKNGKKEYTRTPAVPGFSNRCDPTRSTVEPVENAPAPPGTQCPEGYTQAGIYHNHPPNDSLSPGDLDLGRTGRMKNKKGQDLPKDHQIEPGLRIGATKNDQTSTEIFDPATNTRIKLP